ncbi:MAG: ImpE protein [Gemmataceae bacterium]|nr:ImpE protein [Gemmataceae bacterium]
MTTASEAFQAGRLADAVSAAVEQVRANPADRVKRFFLAELFLFTGELDRADKQLDVLAAPDAPDLMAVTLFRQLLRAETARREVFAHGRVPEFLTQPAEGVKLHLEAAILLRENKPAEAAALLAKAEQSRPVVAGTCDGTAFDDFRDLDDLTAPVLEVLTANGNYYWVPTDTVELIEFQPPARAHDLYWRAAHMVVKDGPDGIVYLPALYHGSHLDPRETIRLGRETDYTGGDGLPYRGTGLREFIVGPDAKPILSLTKIEFGKPS